jgi:hypothetical protein
MIGGVRERGGDARTEGRNASIAGGMGRQRSRSCIYRNKQRAKTTVGQLDREGREPDSTLKDEIPGFAGFVM